MAVEPLEPQVSPAGEVAARPSFLRRNRQRLLAAGVWAAVIIAYQSWALASGLSPGEAAERMLEVLEQPLIGGLLYVAVYALRPLTLVPATVLTLLGGFAFGPVLGVVLTVIAANLSAAVGYGAGRLIGGDLLADPGAEGFAARWAERMRARSFEAVFVMRLIFIPYDIVSFLAGILRIRFWPFILATALGSLPATVAIVLFGASLEEFDGGLPEFDPWVLLASAGLFAASLLVARLVRRRQGPAA